MSPAPKTVYLVKFDLGYYAEKQPHYRWSYTDNWEAAKIYLSKKKAVERGEWGLGLIPLYIPGTSPSEYYPTPKSYVLEEYVIETDIRKAMKKVETQLSN